MRLFAKLRQGVIEIAIGDERRYVEPAILERAYLLWTFRNFRRLSVRVLNQRQREMLERLPWIAHSANGTRIDPGLVIGRAEFAAWPPQKPLCVGSVVSHAANPCCQELMAEAPHAKAITRRLRSVRKGRLLGLVPALHARKTVDALPVGRPRRRTGYSLVLMLASASAVVIGSTAAQRFWAGLSRSPIPAVQASPSLHRSSADKSGSAVRNWETPVPTVPRTTPSSGRDNSAPNPIEAALPIVLQSREGLASTIASRDSRSDSKRREPEGAIRLATQGSPSRSWAGSEAPRLRVLLAPRSVVYPVLPKSGKLGEENQSILVRAVVNTEGTVKDVQVPGQSLGLVRAIAKTVKQWRYQPYVMNGQAMEVETHMIFTVLGHDTMTVRFLPPSESVADR